MPMSGNLENVAQFRFSFRSLFDGTIQYHVVSLRICMHGLLYCVPPVQKAIHNYIILTFSILHFMNSGLQKFSHTGTEKKNLSSLQPSGTWSRLSATEANSEVIYSCAQAASAAPSPGEERRHF